MRLGTLIIVTGALLMATGCSTVTMRDKGQAKLDSDPSYQSSEPFFLWGLVGTSKVDVNEVCQGREAVQLQAQTTFVDGLLRVLTIGIYSPRSARVWCASPSRKAVRS